MKCVKCDYPLTEVVETNHNTSNDLIRRRRSCSKCGHRFTTAEKIKTDDLRRSFQGDK